MTIVATFEIYYYRFDKDPGWGFAQMGEEAFRVKSHDVCKMTEGEDHSQVAAPGYTMYYLWLIRHLKEAAYDVPEFTEKHRWLL